MSKALTLGEVYKAIADCSNGFFDILSPSSVYAVKQGFSSRFVEAKAKPTGEKLQPLKQTYYVEPQKTTTAPFDLERWELRLDKNTAGGTLFLIPKIQKIEMFGGDLLAVAQVQPWRLIVNVDFYSGSICRDNTDFSRCSVYVAHKEKIKPSDAVLWQKKVKGAINKAKRNPAKPTVSSGRGE